MPSTFSYKALLRDSIRIYGITGTVSRLARGAYEVVRDSFPTRRRLRYGDLDYDFEHRVDTTWANVGLRTRVREVFAGRGYQPSDPQIFREMMQQVTADLRSYTFIDLGSGKGRALLLASEYSFGRIVGMELLPELHEIAKENVRKLAGADTTRFDLLCGDARQFAFPLAPIFVYLFDPFPAEILAEVVRRLEDSLAADPRPAILAYQNPYSEHVLAASPRFRKLAGTMQWALFESV